MIRLTALAVLLLTAAAHAQMKRTGAVVFHNNTESLVKVATSFTLDGTGGRHSPGGRWHFKPKEKARLTVGGKAIVAHEYHFHLTTYEGTSTWKSNCTDTDRPGECLVMINEDTLKLHRELLKKPGAMTGERLTVPVSRVRVRNTTAVTFRLDGIYFIDRHNQRATVKGGYWSITPGYDHLLDDQRQPMPVARFEFTLTTTDGASTWWLEGSPTGADVPLTIDAAFLARHRAAAKAGSRTAMAVSGLTEAVRKQAEARVAAAAKDHREASRREPGDLTEALTLRGAAARRLRAAIDAALADLFAGLPEKEREAVRAVLTRALAGDPALMKADDKEALAAITAALKKAGVTAPTGPAAFIAQVRPKG